MSMPGGPQSFYWHRHYHHMYRRGRFFPRLFWFGLGVGAYAWYSHCKETHNAYWNHHGAHRDEWRSWSAHRWGAPYPPRDRLEQARQSMLEQQVTQQHQPPTLPQQDATQTQQWPQGHGRCPRSRAQSQPEEHLMAPGATATPYNAPEPQSSVPSPQEQPFNWHAERIREAGKATSESMSDMSEQALDSLISSIQGLKERIASSRKEREGKQNQQQPSESAGKRLV